MAIRWQQPRRNLGLNAFLGAVSIFSILAAIHALLAVVAFGAYYFGFEPMANFAGLVSLMTFAVTFYPFALLLTLQEIDIRHLPRKVRDLNWLSRELYRVQEVLPLMVLLPLFFSFVAGTIWVALTVRPFERWHIVFIVVCFLGCILLILALLTAGTMDAHFYKHLSKLAEAKPREYMAKPMAEVKEAYRESRPEFMKMFRELRWKLYVAVIFCGLIVCAVVLFGPLDASLFHIIALGPPLAGFWTCYLIMMAVVGNSYSEFTREWLNRLLGQLSGLAVLWLLVAQVIVHARPALLSVLCS